MDATTRSHSHVHIGIAAELTISGLPVAAEDELIRQSTLANPIFARKERLGLWTGATAPSIHLSRRTAEGLVVPRGSLGLVVDLCRQHGVGYSVMDETLCPEPRLDIQMNGRLYDFQERALRDLLRQRTGFLEAPTGSGKTNILLSAIPQLNTPTLVLTHTNGLLDQTTQRCRDWLGVEPGIIGSGTWTMAPVTVAMIQTLARRGCEDIGHHFGAVLIDEAHHSPARTWAAILNALPARYKFGFTATAWRKDGLEALMWRTLGPITARIQAVDAVAAGTILEPHITTVETGFDYDLQDPTDWTAMVSALVRDRDRNQLIAAEVRDRLTPGTRALILTDRIEHVSLLADLLADLDPVVLTGELPASVRRAAMVAVRNGASLTIATAALLGEGIDVPHWDVLFLASPMAGGPRTLQAVGRVTRVTPGKTAALVVDFVDRRVPALLAARRKRVEALGRVA